MSSILQDDQIFNNEVPFCRVYSMESKKELEARFLAHRISYYIEWQDLNFFQRLFSGKSSKSICTFKLNKADLDRAKELVEGIEGLKLKSYGDKKKSN
ncbi:MAG: hypothetical protein K6B41_05995 [Butyrivibrio sp.]|nr:hypothetical protein [Butyrivibrio sp.]